MFQYAIELRDAEEDIPWNWNREYGAAVQGVPRREQGNPTPRQPSEIVSPRYSSHIQGGT